MAKKLRRTKKYFIRGEEFTISGLRKRYGPDLKPFKDGRHYQPRRRK